MARRHGGHTMAGTSTAVHSREGSISVRGTRATCRTGTSRSDRGTSNRNVAGATEHFYGRVIGGRADSDRAIHRLSTTLRSPCSCPQLETVVLGINVLLT